jgi:hypothetical protein
VFGTANLVRVLGPLELEDPVTACELHEAERKEFERAGLPYCNLRQRVHRTAPIRASTYLPASERSGYMGSTTTT